MTRNSVYAAGRNLAEGLVVPLGVAIAVGLAVAQVVPPRWRTGGAPYVAAFGKNVEWLAVVIGLGVGAVTLLLARRRAYTLCIAIAALGGGLAVHLCSAPVVPPLLPLRSAAVLIATALALACWNPTRPASAAPPAGAPAWAIAAALAALCGIIFVRAVGLVTIDPFHHGGAVSAALSLLRGEQPFRDFILAHGLHDAGLIAVWSALIGKLGTSPLTLASATVSAAGVLSLYLLGRRLVGAGLGALAGTAAAVAVLTLLAAQRPTLGRLGMVVFAVLALACSARATPSGTTLMGVALGCGALFRIDVGIFALVAGAGLLVTRHLAGTGTPAGRLRALAADLALLGLGVALPLAGMWLWRGWPDAAWFAYTLRTLPAYHVDSDGLPLGWPVGRWRLPPVVAGLGVLLLTLAWLTTATRALRGLLADGDGRARTPDDLRRIEAVVFVALFTLGALRSALGRSDTVHVLRWVGVPLFAAGWLLLAAPLAAATRRAAGARVPLAWGIVALAAVLLVPLDLRARLQTLQAHLTPNPPAGACGERLLTAAEAELPRNRALIDDQCAVEQLLRERGITRLAIDHSAPWYYVRLGLQPPTRFYMLGKAFSPALQRELIDDLRAARPQALLRARGHWALETFDVDNAFRIPVAEAYLRERRRGVRAVPTGLGTLLLLDEPAADPPPGPALPAGDTQRVVVDRVLYDPTSGFLHASGWAADVASGQRPARLVAVRADGVEEEVRRGEPRPDVAAAHGLPTLQSAGFSTVTRIATRDWPGPPLQVRARFADGREAVAVIDPASARRLPGMTHPDWADLEVQVIAAEALGRADRAAAR